MKYLSLVCLFTFQTALCFGSGFTRYRYQCVHKNPRIKAPVYVIFRASSSAPGGPIMEHFDITKIGPAQGQEESVSIMNRIVRETPPVLIGGTLVYTQILNEPVTPDDVDALRLVNGYLHAYSKPNGEAFLDIHIPGSAVSTRGAVPYRCERQLR